MGNFKVYSDEQVAAASAKLQGIKAASSAVDESERDQYVLEKLNECSRDELLIMVGEVMSRI